MGEETKHYGHNLQVKWADAHGGYGEHFYDYNHGPTHGHEKHVEHAPIYKPH